MRKTTLFMGIAAGVAVALLAVLGGGGGTASADNGPHVVEAGATPDKCAACHRLHTGKNSYLLKEAGTVQTFCYSCHGSTGTGSALSVQNGTFYGTDNRSGGASTTVGLRAGGFDQARINTTDPGVKTIGVVDPPQTVNSKHLVDDTAGTMWGSGALGTSGAGPSAELECTSCHDPHGNGNYRILRTVPQVVLPPATNASPAPGAAGYTIPDSYPKTLPDYTVSNYFEMSFGLIPTVGPTPSPVPGGATPAPGQSILVDTSAWCAQCHTRYLAKGGAPAPDGSRVDSGDAIFTFRHTSSGTSFSTTSGLWGFRNRACITCHATHGSNSSMPGGATGTTYSSTVPWPDGTATSTNADDPTGARMLKMNNRGMCRKCHSTVQ